jgi:four helix bundle protein
MESEHMLQGHRGLRVYQSAYQLALDIHQATKNFPTSERFSLSDQVRRSSRSVAANIAEAYKRRGYPKAFVNKLVECSGESAETEVWLDMAKDLGYLTEERHEVYIEQCSQIQKMLDTMIRNPGIFCKAPSSRQS